MNRRGMLQSILTGLASAAVAPHTVGELLAAADGLPAGLPVTMVEHPYLIEFYAYETVGVMWGHPASVNPVFE